ncbi:MAG: protein kinase [Phycisphaerales bacterium]
MTTDAPKLGFALDDETWIGLVRESVAPLDLGVVNGYQLLGELGRGGQAVVFKAVQPGTNRMVALKRVPGGPMAGRAARARFAREVEALGALTHPGIVSVYGVEPSGDSTLLVMECVEGLPIDRWAARATMHERVRAVALAADALAHAHRKGVIHRDLKPSNLLVTADGCPRVLDFGLAALTDGAGGLLGESAVSLAGSGFLGTPAYASPEQLRGDRAGARHTHGHLFAGRDPLSGAHRAAAVPAARPCVADRIGKSRRTRASVVGKPADRPRSRRGGALSLGDRACQAVPVGRCAGRRPAPLDERRAGERPPAVAHRPDDPPGAEVPSRLGRAPAGSGGDGHTRRREHGADGAPEPPRS